MPTSQIDISRIIPFSNAQVLAKQAEERMLIREMRSDAIQQTIRRLAKVQH